MAACIMVPTVLPCGCRPDRDQFSAAFNSILTLVLAMLIFASLAHAQPALQGQGSMEIGNATISIGAGPALLTLPDIEFTLIVDGPGTVNTIGKEKNNEFDDETGWGIDGAIEFPVDGAAGGPTSAVLKGFYSRIEHDDTTNCVSAAGASCAISPIIQVDPATRQKIRVNVGSGITTTTNRDVAHWGLSLEAKRYRAGAAAVQPASGVSRHFAFGLDLRAIDQDIKSDGEFLLGGGVSMRGNGFSYREDLDTRYYGLYGAVAGAYSLPFVGAITSGWGLHSSFRLWGGVYYADADYQGRYVQAGPELPPQQLLDQRLSLSSDDVAFIGGLTLETRKQLGRRTALTLKSDYEYYSWVPDMAYNDTDSGALCGTCAGFNNGTSIGSDDAFSIRTLLRLTIKLGPDALYR